MPGARALLLIVLAALLTVLAGPSAAAAAPGDPDATSVAGIAPNGDDATSRFAHPSHPVPSVLPGDRTTPRTPDPVRATVPTAPAVASGDPAVTHQDRAPPTC